MEASSQIQNLLRLSLLHLCGSFFHYLTFPVLFGIAALVAD